MTLKELYDNNVNIMNYFREKDGLNNNSVNAILVSYELQACSYIKDWEKTVNSYKARNSAL